MNLSVLSVLGATLLAGCVTQPGEEQIDEGGADQPAQAPASAPAASEDPALADGALDGRAAAAAEAKTHGTDLAVSMSLASSWYSGSVAPGGTQHWYWNNAGTTAVYQVGLSPTGASTSSACHFQVTRAWDVQQYGGEREFHFIIKNIGAITCGTNILLASQQSFGAFPTGGLEAGASRSWTWNNANPLTSSYLVNVSPSGATSLNTCELEATRTWYAQEPGGEREFKYTITNVGNIACQGNILLAQVPSSGVTWSLGTLSPGASHTSVWNNANPLTRVYVPGLSPSGAVGTSACQLEVSPTSYRQVINSTGTLEREFYLTFRNIGSVACGGTVLLNHLD